MSAGQQTGACMYCGRADVPVSSDGFLHDHIARGTSDGCRAPIFTRPGTLHQQLSDLLGYGGRRKIYGPWDPGLLLERVRCLLRDYRNVEEFLDGQGITRGDMASLSLLGRLHLLVGDDHAEAQR